MTPLEHNKYLGIAHVGYAGFQLLMMIVLVAFIGIMLSDVYGQARRMGGDAPPAFLVVVFVFGGLLQIAMSVPPIVAGYALLKRRPWAKIAAIIGGVVAAMSFPIGTALAVYTFWFLFSDVGKQLYDNKVPGLPPPPPSEWQSSGINQQQDQEYSEPTRQPDWRG